MAANILASVHHIFSEGQDKGINLSLETAIEMARRMAETGRNAHERGAALFLLGNALRLLGTRENGTARLEEAVAAYREALKEPARACRSNGPRPR